MKLFTCENHPGSLKLTEQACAGSYQLAQKDHDRLHICRNCPVGAKNADEPVQEYQGADKCVRCDSTLAFRRVHGVYCISCWNRTCEVLRGYNRKGCAPVKAKLFVFQLVVDGRPVKMVVSNSMLTEFVLRAIENGDHQIKWPDLNSHAITTVPLGVGKGNPPSQAIKQLESFK